MLILSIQKLHEINNGMLFYLLVEGNLKKNNGNELATICKSSFRLHVLGNQYTDTV